MYGYPSVYKDQFGKNWIADYCGGTRENPSGPLGREGFTNFGAAVEAADTYARRERGLYHVRLQETYAAERVEEVHKRAADNRGRRLVSA